MTGKSQTARRQPSGSVVGAEAGIRSASSRIVSSEADFLASAMTWGTSCLEYGVTQNHIISRRWRYEGSTSIPRLFPVRIVATEVVPVPEKGTAGGFSSGRHRVTLSLLVARRAASRSRVHSGARKSRRRVSTTVPVEYEAAQPG